MAVTPGPIAVTLTPDRDIYRPGETVEFQVTLRNTGTAPVYLYFSSSQTFDITVTTPAGDAVWHWANGRYFAQSIRELTLAPGEERISTATWDQRTNAGAAVTLGRYHAVATAPIENNPASPSVTLTIQE